MKKINVILSLLFLSVIGSAFTMVSTSGKNESLTRLAKVLWEKDVYDFGEIKKDVPVFAEFTFTNEGQEPFVISSVKSSCGCTVADYPKEAILPGETGTIKASYNAKNMGAFNKKVTISGNTESGNKTLTIKGIVVE